MRLVLLIVGVVFCRASYTSGRSRVRSPLDNLIDQTLPAITDSVNRFAFLKLKGFPGDLTSSVLISPTELFFYYWAAKWGSLSNQGDDFEAVFPPRGISYPDVERGLRALRDRISEHSGLCMNTTGNVFHHSGFHPPNGFNDTVKRVLLMETNILDFKRQNETVNAINAWSARATRNRVPVVVKPYFFSDQVSVALINIVSFKGKWNEPPTLLPNQTFRVDESRKVSIPFMRQIGVYAHGELPTLDAKFIEIPYRTENPKNGISLIVILPNKVNGLLQLENNIHTIGLSQLLNGQRTEMVLKMPQIRMKQMYYDIYFNRYNGSLPNTQTNNFAMGKIYHFLSFDVDDTIDSTSVEEAGVPSTTDFVADHPFVTIVATTGNNPVILLEARYSGPQEWPWKRYFPGGF